MKNLFPHLVEIVLVFLCEYGSMVACLSSFHEVSTHFAPQEFAPIHTSAGFVYITGLTFEFTFNSGKVTFLGIPRQLKVSVFHTQKGSAVPRTAHFCFF